jgi:LytS/YehU family sensor histidine kinase
MLYTITKINIFNKLKEILISVFIFDSWYSGITFQGIIPNNRAVGVSIAGLPQVTILNKLDPTILVDSSIAGNYRIKFGIGETLFLRIIQIDI